MKNPTDEQNPLILTRALPAAGRSLRDVKMRRERALYGHLTGDSCDSDDVEERTSWAYLAQKTETQLRDRLLKETDPFILGELVERAVGTQWLDETIYAHIRTVGGRALMHAALDPDADAATVDAFVALVLACEDRSEYNHLCHPLNVEWVTCHLAAAHPRVLPEIIAHTARHALVRADDIERTPCWLTGRPHLLDHDHITSARARLVDLTEEQDTIVGRLWWALSLASPTVNDWATIADVQVHTLRAIRTLPPAGTDLFSTICQQLWDDFPGTVGELLSVVAAICTDTP